MNGLKAALAGLAVSVIALVLLVLMWSLLVTLNADHAHSGTIFDQILRRLTPRCNPALLQGAR